MKQNINLKGQRKKKKYKSYKAGGKYRATKIKI